MRIAVVARELTKIFETVLDGTLATLQTQVVNDDNQRKGEFVIIVKSAADQDAAKITEDAVSTRCSKNTCPLQVLPNSPPEITGAPRKALYGG